MLPEMKKKNVNEENIVMQTNAVTRNSTAAPAPATAYIEIYFSISANYGVTFLFEGRRPFVWSRSYSPNSSHLKRSSFTEVKW